MKPVEANALEKGQEVLVIVDLPVGVFMSFRAKFVERGVDENGKPTSLTFGNGVAMSDWGAVRFFVEP